jgi:hypothetical protein
MFQMFFNALFIATITIPLAFCFYFGIMTLVGRFDNDILERIDIAKCLHFTLKSSFCTFVGALAIPILAHTIALVITIVDKIT